MSSKNWLQFCSFKMAVIRMEGTVCQNVCSFVVSETVKQQDQKKLVYVFEKVAVVLQFQNGSDLEGCQSLPKPLQFCSFGNGQTIDQKNLVYVFEKVAVVLQFQNGSDLEGCQSLPKPLQFCSFRNGQTVGPKKFGVCLRKTGCSFVVSKWQ